MELIPIYFVYLHLFHKLLIFLHILFVILRLGFYHILAEFGVKNLKTNGVILVEFGIGQAKCVKEIFSNKMFENFLAVKDDNGIIRAAQIKF